MRILHARADHVGGGARRRGAGDLRRRDPRVHERQYLSLRRLSQYRRGDQDRRIRPEGVAMHPFTYRRARRTEDALTLAAQEPGTEFLAGGTDMLQLLKDDVRRPSHLLDIGGVEGLDGINIGPDGLRLG